MNRSVPEKKEGMGIGQADVWLEIWEYNMIALP